MNADLIIKQIRDFAATSPANRMPGEENSFIFDTPLVKFADGDAPIFTEYKSIIGNDHLTPPEAMALAYERKPDAPPDKVSVISWILPITEKTRESNRGETRVPSRLWSHTRWFGELFNNTLREFVVELLANQGFLATAPMIAPYFKIYRNDKGMYSNWSERHIAYAAGLGTFSLSDGLITEQGIAHRCGSVVTSLELPASTRTVAGPYSNCLTYADEECGKCIGRCPVEAITKEGHDKVKCGQHLHDIGYSPQSFRESGYDLEKSVAGCGLCQTGVPCEAVNPTLKLKN